MMPRSSASSGLQKQEHDHELVVTADTVTTNLLNSTTRLPRHNKYNHSLLSRTSATLIVQCCHRGHLEISWARRDVSLITSGHIPSVQ